jgi:hypothetical protein
MILFQLTSQPYANFAFMFPLAYLLFGHFACAWLPFPLAVVTLCGFVVILWWLPPEDVGVDYKTVVLLQYLFSSVHFIRRALSREVEAAVR